MTIALSAFLFLATPLVAVAAGLGKLTVLSALGQPLHAEIEISASREELPSMSARMAPPTAFQQAGIEYGAALSGIRFSVEQRPDGRAILNVASDRALNEPFLDMLVELSWSSGRLLREYTFLLDLPESLHKSQAAPPAPAALPEARREPPAAVQPSAGAPAAAEPPAAAPAEEKKKARPDLQVVRGADGVQRIVKAAPAPEAEKPAKEAATRQVNRGDTLSKIAAETKPDGVNLDQMLVALFRGNQDAFVGNVNRLKAGKILTIPDRDTAAGVDPDEAKKTIQAHAADFNAYSKKLAASVAGAPAPKEEAPQREVSGKIAPKVESKAPVLSGKDKLEVSKAEAAGPAGDKAGAARLAAVEETLVSREKALKEANSRIAELDKNLSDLRKLVELKNQSMAELQKQAQAAKPAAPPVAAKEPAAAPQPPAAKAAEKPAEKIAPPKPAEAAPPAAPAKPAEAAPAPAAKPVPVEKKPTPPAPPPRAETSFVDDSPEIVYGGGAVLALLLGYFGYARWRKQRETQPAAEPSPAVDMSIFGNTNQPEPPADLTDFGRTPVGMEPSSAAVDPVAEADVYLAYGRDAQAEEILIDARKSDPQRRAIHLKLLEIYAARKSVKQFEAIATDLHDQTQGQGPDWEKARQLGLQVDPDNTLYADPMAPQQEAFDPEATMVIAPHAETEQSLVTEAAPEAAVPPPEIVEEPEPAPEPEPELPAQEEVPVSLDFDFDLPVAAAEPAAQEALAAASAPTPAESSGPLEIDLDLSSETAPPTIAAMDDAAPVAAEAAHEAAAQAAPSLDMDFDLDIATPAATPSEPAAAPAGAATGLDFNFDLDSSPAAAAAGPAETVDVAAPAEPGDGNMIDFDLELPASETAKRPSTSIDMSSINLDLGQPAAAAPVADAPPAQRTAGDDSAMQDVATKLELAQAYEEMGDKEGARELLQEVINEGNAAQQATARSKLALLG